MTGRGPDRYGAEAAIKASDLPAPSRLLLHTLLTHVTNGTMNVPATYSPSITKLARETGLGRGTVADHLNLLERDGWIKRRRPTTAQALKRNECTAYLIRPPADLVPPSESRTGPPVREPNGGSTGAGRGASESRTGPRPGAGHNPTYRPTSSSPTEKKDSARVDEHPRFAEWYAAYPLHKSRGAAVKAFAKAAEKADPDTLIVAAKRYRDDPQVRRGFTKHPATWLNQECWLDDVDEPLAADGYRPYRNPTDQSVYDEAI